ncbi:P-type conjugative transfer protein TrbG [Candidatus Fukatsuia symbiotica]|nr:P-type conjugative transfer protein TrbG [Candidatus Fukatsuia symbiotica]
MKKIFVMKQIVFALIFGLIPRATMAVPADNQLAEQYFSDNEPLLTSQEKAALSIGQQWQTGSTTSKPFAGQNGAINYVYTTGQTQILCAVLQVCDVALQPGEQVNNLNVGDPRFNVEPAITGAGDAKMMHLLIKPLDVGLDTSMVVTTNRRTYHFRLRSSRNQFMPFVSFTYPEDAQAKWNAIRENKVKERQEKTIPQTGEYLGDLDFNYDLKGSARWKPTRVYNDGRKTIIEMPATMKQSEAPVLLVIRKNGSRLSDGETQMVNYRVQGNRYIVDTVFEKAMLISGVGSSQNRITITKGK